MANEPVWLTADHLIEFNELEVSASGEPHVVRDLAGLESALARPINHWHYGEADVVALAVALLLGVARNIPSYRATSAPPSPPPTTFPISTAMSYRQIRMAKSWANS